VLPPDVAAVRAHRRERRARERDVARLILLLGVASAASMAVRRSGVDLRSAIEVRLSALRDGAVQPVAFLGPDSAQAVADLTARMATFEEAAEAAVLPTSLPTLALPTVVLPTPIAAVQVGGYEKAPGLLRPLTADGCCADAWWSGDGRRVMYLDRPENQPAAAIFEVAVWPPGSPPVAADLELARRAGAARYVVRPAGGASIVEDMETGAEWTVATGGHPARISPDGSRIVWWEGRGDRSQYDAAVSIHAASIDGTGATELATLWGSSVFDFLPDSRTVVVTGRPDRNSPVFLLAKLDTVAGGMTELARGAWLSDAAVAPSGQWVVYMVSLDTVDVASNGLWVVSSDGGSPTRLPFVGAYRWRDGQRLLYVPQILDAEADEIWEYDASTGQVRLLLGTQAGIRIANNDWSASPDGGSILFRSSTDFNLWVVDLP
jgi:hypothetical protein